MSYYLVILCFLWDGSQTARLNSVYLKQLELTGVDILLYHRQRTGPSAAT
jgi:hypothetical protein